MTFSEKKELESLPDAIEQAEARIATLATTLADPKTYAGGGGDAAQLSAKLDVAREEVERLMQRWEELESKA
jgi:ATP-binding cassette subfamily F protein uup